MRSKKSSIMMASFCFAYENQDSNPGGGCRPLRALYLFAALATSWLLFDSRRSLSLKDWAISLSIGWAGGGRFGDGGGSGDSKLGKSCERFALKLK